MIFEFPLTNSRRLEPHWDAANPESLALALKLGYKPAGSYLAHFIAGY